MCDPRDLGVAITEDIAEGAEDLRAESVSLRQLPGRHRPERAAIQDDAQRCWKARWICSRRALANRGCPSCVGPIGEVGERGKEAAKLILEELLKAKSA